MSNLSSEQFNDKMTSMKRTNSFLFVAAIVILIGVIYSALNIKTETNFNTESYSKDMVQVFLGCNVKYTHTIFDHKRVDELNKNISTTITRYMHKYYHPQNASEIYKGVKENNKITNNLVLNELISATIDGVFGVEVTMVVTISDEFMQRIMDKQIAITDSIVAQREIDESKDKLAQLLYEKQRMEIQKHQSIVDAELMKQEAIKSIERADKDKIEYIKNILTIVLKDEGYSSVEIEKIIKKHELTIKR